MFIFVIKINEPLGHTCPSRYVFHARGGVAFLRKFFQRRLEYGGGTHLRPGARRFFHAVLPMPCRFFDHEVKIIDLMVKVKISR